MQYLCKVFTIFLFFTITVCFFSKAQSSNDSTYAVLSALPDDTNKIKQLFSLGYTLEESDTTLCNKVYNDALRISKKINNPYFECKTLINLGVLKRTHEKHDAALDYYQQAYRVAVSSGNAENIGSSLANIGNIHHRNNNFEEAIKHCLEAIPWLEKANKPRQLSLTIGNLCALYEQQQFYEKAIEYGLKAVDAALQSKDDRTIGLAYMNLAINYNRVGDNKKFLALSLLTLDYLRNTPMKQNVQQAYENISTAYLGVKEIKKAKAYADSSLQVARELNHNRLIAKTLMLNGSIAIEEKNYAEAEKNIMESKTFAQADGGWTELRDWNKFMSMIESGRGNFKTSLAYFKLQKLYDDSLKNETILQNNLALEKKYETQKKQLQISELEKEKQIQQLSIKQKNNLLYVFGCGLAIAVLIGFLVYRNNRQKHIIQSKRIKELEQEKQLLAIDNIMKVQEAERARMAKDLHDGLGGMLSGIKLNLSSIKGNVVVHEKDAAIFSKSINQLDNAIAEMRRVAHNMMPEALLKFGLTEAVQDYCDGINESNTVKIKFTSLGILESLQKSTEVVLYRIIQELTNNAIKHASAKNILIQLSKNENLLILTVEDDGKGFDTKQLPNIKGTGLQNVQSRVDYLKGKLEIQSIIGNGISVTIEIPN